MKTLRMVLVLLLALPLAGLAQQVDKGYLKRATKHINANPGLDEKARGALAEQRLVYGLDIETAKVVGYGLTSNRGPIGGWFRSTMRQRTEETDGQRVTTVEFYRERWETDRTYLQDSNLNVVATTAKEFKVRTTWLTMEFEEGLLVRWKQERGLD